MPLLPTRIFPSLGSMATLMLASPAAEVEAGVEPKAVASAVIPVEGDDVPVVIADGVPVVIAEGVPEVEGI